MRLLCLACNEGPVKWDDEDRVAHGDTSDLETSSTCRSCGFVYEEGLKTYTEMLRDKNERHR